MKYKNSLFKLILAVLVVFFVFGGTFYTSSLAVPYSVASIDNAEKPMIVKAYGKIPMHFETNIGQTDQQVKFLSRGSGYTLFLTSTEAVLSLRRHATHANSANKKDFMSTVSGNRDSKDVTNDVLRVQLLNANPTPQVTGLDKLPGHSNYFKGNDPEQWRTNVPNYARVSYKDVYPGIDLIYYGNQRQLEYDFIVAPGAVPEKIKLLFNGADRVELDERGNLVIHTGSDKIIQQAPIIYQEINGFKQEIAGRYVLRENNQVGFQLAGYDRRRPVIIDPVLIYSTYLGGSGDDSGNDIAVDASGNAYIVGTTNSIDFPTAPTPLLIAPFSISGNGQSRGITMNATGNGFENTGVSLPTNPFQDSLAGGDDVFVTKLNAAGTALVYSTYLGGSEDEIGRSIAVDASGNAYVTGDTVSADFPTAPSPLEFIPLPVSSNGQGKGITTETTGSPFETEGVIFPTGPFQDALHGSEDAFVTKLSADGAELVYSTYLGGALSERGSDIAVDTSGNAYVSGETFSLDFPLQNPIQAAIASDLDAYVTKLNFAGTALVYSTYIGGTDLDVGNSIAVDVSDNAFLAGTTRSTDFPTTNSIQNTIAGELDAFVTKINAIGSGLVYSTYLGGSGDDTGNDIAVDASGNAYITGQTGSTNFPTVNPFQDIRGGNPFLGPTSIDAYVTKISADGSGLVYSSYLGGAVDFETGVLTGNDFGNGIAVDASGNAYVTGSARSDFFPIRSPIQGSRAGGSDVFVTKLNVDGSDLVYSTYLGGSGIDQGFGHPLIADDFGKGIAVDASGNAYVTGLTESSTFPMVNPLQDQIGGGFDAFVAKIEDVTIPTTPMPTSTPTITPTPSATPTLTITPSPTPIVTITPTPIVVPTVTPVSPPIPTTINVVPTEAGRSFFQSIATVTIFDQRGLPMPDVIVNATTSGRGVRVRPSSTVTGATGSARFLFRFGFVARDGVITFSAGSSSATITQK